MNLRFCEDFKGTDALLLFGSPDAVRQLAQRIQSFAASSAIALPVHEFAVNHPEQSIELFAVRAPGASKKVAVLSFAWFLGPLILGDVIAKLEALADAESGHQYFELLDSDVELIMSVGEYDALGTEKTANHGLQPTVTSGLRPPVPAAEPSR
jgi:hypothetical protein